MPNLNKHASSTISTRLKPNQIDSTPQTWEIPDDYDILKRVKDLD